jgi:hypothetical protein
VKRTNLYSLFSSSSSIDTVLIQICTVQSCLLALIELDYIHITKHSIIVSCRTRHETEKEYKENFLKKKRKRVIRSFPLLRFFSSPSPSFPISIVLLLPPPPPPLFNIRDLVILSSPNGNNC